MLKHWTGGLRESGYGYLLGHAGWIGGVACSQRLMTLTGESPTPFQVSWIHRADKSMTKRLWLCGGASVPLLVPSLGDGSFPGVAA